MEAAITVAFFADEYPPIYGHNENTIARHAYALLVFWLLLLSRRVGSGIGLVVHGSEYVSGVVGDSQSGPQVARDAIGRAGLLLRSGRTVFVNQGLADVRVLGLI